MSIIETTSSHIADPFWKTIHLYGLVMWFLMSHCWAFSRNASLIHFSYTLLWPLPSKLNYGVESPSSRIIGILQVLVRFDYPFKIMRNLSALNSTSISPPLYSARLKVLSCQKNIATTFLLQEPRNCFYRHCSCSIGSIEPSLSFLKPQLNRPVFALNILLHIECPFDRILVL